jgi:hypothetical protein
MAYNSLTLVPAYGRDYSSKKALITDWEAGKDFMAMDLHSSGYTSIRDATAFKEDGITHLHFRYNKQTLVHVVKL